MAASIFTDTSGNALVPGFLYIIPKEQLTTEIASDLYQYIDDGSATPMPHFYPVVYLHGSPKYIVFIKSPSEYRMPKTFLPTGIHVGLPTAEELLHKDTVIRTAA